EDCIAFGTPTSSCDSYKAACTAHVTPLCTRFPTTTLTQYKKELDIRQRNRCISAAESTWEACYRNAQSGSVCTFATNTVCPDSQYTVAVTGNFNSDGVPDAFYYDPGLGNARLALTGHSSAWSKGFNGYDFKNTNDQVITVNYDGDGDDDL